ncbi:DUF2937 family protein [Thalassovita sp.]|uniref:DUF2937 family protein n=1 Tax=Thalassovita sp. TaxID=1979401 RepID=UPI002882184F|nr:DUF2937 family protein [Thalassovita sp.]MDF1801825.1 DUF2937 family protein [Thalassovita sp.]
MIIRALTLAGGLAGAGAASQFPEFSQQYTQRLGGAVDALATVAAEFDASARVSGLTRNQALEQMVGSDFVARRRADMERVFTRHAQLSADLETLHAAGPFMRAYHATRLNDRDIATRAWEAYQPAIPTNFAGAVFGGLGFLSGAVLIALALATLRWPVRLLRRKPAQAA